MLISFCSLSLSRFANTTKLIRNRGSYRSAQVLELLNEKGKSDKMRGLPSILSLFRIEFNKFTITGAQMLDSFYHCQDIKIFFFWCEKQDFAILTPLYNGPRAIN